MGRTYYIKQRILSFGATFDIYDEMDNVKFLVEADRLDFGKNISIYTSDKSKKLMYLKQVIRLGSHKYIIYDENMREVGVLEKEMLVPNYQIEYFNETLHMKGKSIWARAFEICKGNQCIGDISKEISFRDKYVLKVEDETYTNLLIGLLIVVDMVHFHDKNQ